MTRSKLTIAAEIAAVGAFVIAVLAIVVTVFFDTGIRIPWKSEGQSQSSVVTSPVTTSTTPSQSTTTSQPATSSQPQSTPANETRQSTPTPVARHWLGLKLAAAKEFGDGASFWVVVLFALLALVAMGSIVWALYAFFIPISVMSHFFAAVVPMGAIGYLYLWTFWTNLSNLGVVVFILGAIITTVYPVSQS
ncbi:hypothetical protein [Actinokineospora alba]|uniref:hypothetical protein n=1 Tax=Actinokineospora alba TaxID=504798 RepID=UPI00105EF124|nr:hypothetical protein [Actinokineospora alba]